MKSKPRLIPLNSLDELTKNIDKNGNTVGDKKITRTSYITARIYPWQEHYAFEIGKHLGGLRKGQLLSRLLTQEIERLLLKKTDLKPGEFEDPSVEKSKAVVHGQASSKKRDTNFKLKDKKSV